MPRVGRIDHPGEGGVVVGVGDREHMLAGDNTRLRGENRAQVSFNLHKRVDAQTWLAFARPAKAPGRG